MKKAFIYNSSFFDISQTFIYHQVDALAEEFKIHLLSTSFLNPHGFEISAFHKHPVSRVSGFRGRVVAKLLNKRVFDRESRKRMKMLITTHKPDVIHAHFGTRALDMLPYAKKYDIPLVVSFHGADASRMTKYDNYMKRLPALFDYASAIIISSTHMAETLKLDSWTEKVHWIPYGVDPGHFQLTGKNGADDQIKILHSGRLTPKKGVPDLLRVFQQLQEKYGNLHLEMIGDGEETDICKSLISDLGLNGSVTLHGSVPHSVVQKKMEESTLFVLNSRVAPDGDMEGTPVTILEAMCMGMPVATTRHAGIPAVIEHGKNGLLADEKNNEQLYEILDRLISDSHLRDELGKNARSTIESGYTVKHMKSKIQEVFRNL